MQNIQSVQNLQNKLTKPNQPNQTYQTKPTKPNLPKQTYQTKPTEPNLPSQTYQAKPSKPNLPNQTYQTKSNLAYQAYWTKPTKPESLVKAVNAWVRSAFGNVSTTNTGRADPRREERASREGPVVEEAVGRKKHQPGVFPQYQAWKRWNVAWIMGIELREAVKNYLADFFR